jgi:integrase
MAKRITDLTIKSWLGGRFEGKACGNGLYLVYRETMATPLWRFRYRLAGKQRQMFIGSYKDLTLAEATKEAKRLNALVSLGHDVAKEKQDRKLDGIAKREADKNRITVAMLAERYYQERVQPKLKKPENELSHIKRVSGYLGGMFVEDVTGKHINGMYQKDLARGYPASTNKLREHTRRAFGFAAAQHIIPHNPAQWLDISYAGGKQETRERNLSRDELVTLFQSMGEAKGFGRENYLTIKLLLLLCVRKSELIKAVKSEFDLGAGVWAIGKHRTKTKAGFDIPLPTQAIEALNELFVLSGQSDCLLPARSPQHKRLPHISEATLNVALKKIQGIDHFTVHDLRRTAKTMLQANGVDEFISERCLNHKLSGVSGTYGRHDFFEERKKALQFWANYLESCETGTQWNVTPIKKQAVIK